MKDREMKHDDLWTPNELTPVQEEVHLAENFEPTNFKIFSAEEIGQFEFIGKSERGLNMSFLPDGETVIYTEHVRLNMQVIEKINESPYICKILGVLETDPNDPEIATKVAILDPNTTDDDNYSSFSKLVQGLAKSKTDDGKEVFKMILEALLDTRKRLPPIYNFRFDNIMVDKAAKGVKIIITDDLFQKDSDIINLEKESLLYISPEEL